MPPPGDKTEPHEEPRPDLLREEDDQPADSVSEPLELDEDDVADFPEGDPMPPVSEVRPEHVAYIREIMNRFAVRPAHEREDLVQEILYQMHRSRASQIQPRALLWGITRHIVFRWMTKRSNERAAVRGYIAEQEEPAAQATAEENWQAVERTAAIRDALDEVPEILRLVLERCDLEETPMSAVTRELGIPLNTGYTRLHLARARFTEALTRQMARRRLKPEDLCVPLWAGSFLREAARWSKDLAPAPPSPGLDVQPGAGPGAPLTAAHQLGALGQLTWIGGGLAGTALLAAALAAALPSILSPPGPAPAPSASAVAVAAPATGASPPSSAAPAPATMTASGAASPPRRPPPIASPAAAPPRPTAPAASTARPLPPRPHLPPLPQKESDGSMGRSIMRLLCSGQIAEAKTRTEELIALHPRSPYIQPIQQILDSGLDSTAGKEGCRGFKRGP